MVKLSEKQASYSVTIGAKKLGISKYTLREYEKKGLIRPFNDPINGRSLFFNRDLEWIRHIRKLIHHQRLNIASIQRPLAVIPCYKIKNCPKVKKERCPASADKTRPCWVIVQRSSIEEVNKCWACKVYADAQKRLRKNFFD